MNDQHHLLPADFTTRTPSEKERYLEASADKVIRDETIRLPLSDEKKESLRFRLEKASIKLTDAVDEYDEVKKYHRDVIKDLKDNLAEILAQLRTGVEQIQGNKYEIRDYDSGRVTVFAADGTEIESRPMLPEERQSTINSSMRKVDNP